MAFQAQEGAHGKANVVALGRGRAMLRALNAAELFETTMILFNYDPLILVEYNIEQGNSVVPFRFLKEILFGSP